MMAALIILCTIMVTVWACRWVLAVLGWAACRAAVAMLYAVKVGMGLRPRRAAVAPPLTGGNVLVFRRRA
ncbi:hypothetical protein [Rhodoblastus sp.]|jgi:hypothetical protein|uniref:hypothetical protein n=1 Tax=Rhodoblastus sp. TaxID=1962975 RepID=UPI0025EE0F17|nr:hypothetical protein [Rhodoblastus sp.]